MRLQRQNPVPVPILEEVFLGSWIQSNNHFLSECVDFDAHLTI